MRGRATYSLLFVLAILFSVGLVVSAGRASYVWWSWHHGNHFCSTPISGAFELAFVAFLLFSFLILTLRAMAKKKNAA